MACYLQYGVIISQGSINIDRYRPNILEDADNGLTHLARQAVFSLYQEFLTLNDKIAEAES